MCFLFFINHFEISVILLLFVFSYPSQAVLKLPDIVDFGSAVANCKVIAKELVLYNEGSKSGNFELKYTGSKPITINPCSGSVPPKSHKRIKVIFKDLYAN